MAVDLLTPGAPDLLTPCATIGPVIAGACESSPAHSALTGVPGAANRRALNFPSPFVWTNMVAAALLRLV